MFIRIVSLRKFPSPNISAVDRHRFNADPDLDPNFHVDADPDPNPDDWHLQDADPHLKNVGK
jgi:hypothetical protein